MMNNSNSEQIRACNPERRRRLAAQRASRTARATFDRLSRGFTLVELLVVIAITSIILTLLFAPLIQGFNFTRRARAISTAQESARTGLALMRRELSQAAYIFDNTQSPLFFPIQANRLEDRYRLPQSVLDQSPDPNVYKASLLYTKIDLVQPARVAVDTTTQITDPTTNTAIDPTTGATGTNIRFPMARGTRAVRYFIALREPFQRLANGQFNYAANAARFYDNVFEFRRSDSELNPFILYRAEYDPNDPNLFNTATPDAYNNPAPDAGGFNDPNFFYNTQLAANGATYAENWGRASQAVLTAQNLDLLVVRRTDVGAIDTASPFRTTVSFAPTTVVGDTATPGFLSNDASEAPGAVPS
ncbi:MAG: type II secretion system protein, partial [Cytophagales bacterium]|nr:type II secretion system protein [Armatimonadota bacterium]